MQGRLKGVGWFLVFCYFENRFLCLMLLFFWFSYVLDGVPRMRERPIGDLVVGLKQLGADVECTLGTNCPPVRVNANGGLPGGKVRDLANLYEQFQQCVLITTLA